MKKKRTEEKKKEKEEEEVGKARFMCESTTARIGKYGGRPQTECPGHSVMSM